MLYFICNKNLFLCILDDAKHMYFGIYLLIRVTSSLSIMKYKVEGIVNDRFLETTPNN
jgi:hypothetical protein